MLISGTADTYLSASGGVKFSMAQHLFSNLEFHLNLEFYF